MVNGHNVATHKAAAQSRAKARTFSVRSNSARTRSSNASSPPPADAVPLAPAPPSLCMLDRLAASSGMPDIMSVEAMVLAPPLDASDAADIAEIKDLAGDGEV